MVRICPHSPIRLHGVIINWAQGWVYITFIPFYTYDKMLDQTQHIHLKFFFFKISTILSTLDNYMSFLSDMTSPHTMHTVRIFRPGRTQQTECALDLVGSIIWDKTCMVHMGYYRALITVRLPPPVLQCSCNHCPGTPCYTSPYVRPEGQV
jgi:hypothetical protein